MGTKSILLVLPIPNVSFTKSIMSVLHKQTRKEKDIKEKNPKCQFYKIQSVGFTKSKVSIFPIQNVSFTKSKMSVLQNPKCQFYKIQNVSFTNQKCQFSKSKMSVLHKHNRIS